MLSLGAINGNSINAYALAGGTYRQSFEAAPEMAITVTGQGVRRHLLRATTIAAANAIGAINRFRMRANTSVVAGVVGSIGVRRKGIGAIGCAISSSMAPQRRLSGHAQTEMLVVGPARLHWRFIHRAPLARHIGISRRRDDIHVPSRHERLVVPRRFARIRVEPEDDRS